MKTFLLKSRYILLAASLSATMAACDETTLDYEPGDLVSSDCMNVFFSPDNENHFIFSSDELGDDYSVSLKLSRVKTDNAADVPVIVEMAAECFSIEQTAHFDAGETDTEIKVSFQGIPKSTAQKMFLRIPDEYVNMYAQQEGVGRYSGEVLLAEWRKIVKDAEIYGYGSSGVDYVADIYWLPGANRFRFMNWMESGLNVTFRLIGTAFDPDNTTTWHGSLYPLDNYEERDYNDDGSLYRWFLYDDDNGQRPRWYTSGGKLQNGNITFYTNLSRNEFNLIDGGIDGYDYCHGFMYKYNGGSDWIYFDYNAEDINLEGWPEDTTEE